MSHSQQSAQAKSKLYNTIQPKNDEQELCIPISGRFDFLRLTNALEGLQFQRFSDILNDQYYKW
ncbi:MAG: hypothetical protein AAF570_28875, partial [Bacteroidota bacterium]